MSCSLGGAKEEVVVVHGHVLDIPGSSSDLIPDLSLGRVVWFKVVGPERLQSFIGEVTEEAKQAIAKALGRRVHDAARTSLKVPLAANRRA